MNTLGIIGCIKIYFDEKDSINWPTVNATVKKVDIYKSRNKRGMLNCIRLTYEFVIGADKHTSFETESCRGNRVKTEERAKSFQPNSTVIKVFYNPKKPNWGWLTPPDRSDLCWTILFLTDSFLLLIWLILKLALTNKDAIRL
jgi:hypothetical protein